MEHDPRNGSNGQAVFVNSPIYLNNTCNRKHKFDLGCIRSKMLSNLSIPLSATHIRPLPTSPRLGLYQALSVRWIFHLLSIRISVSQRDC
jgi:hypothetical protein